MNKFQLTREEEIELRVEHRRVKEKKEADRIKSLILLGKGWTYSKVAETLLLDEETLKSYEARYRTGGLNKLLKDAHK